MGVLIADSCILQRSSFLHIFEHRLMARVLHKKWFSELTTQELYELLRIRNDVFVVEQDCVYQDLDYDDQPAMHLWLTEDDNIVALCRV